MEEGRRKQVMIGTIVVCLTAAAYITFFRGGGEDEGLMRRDIAEDATIWVKCVNTRCGDTYEMNEIEYREFQRQHLAEDTEPGMTCEKCGKASAFEAIKCPKCGNVFISGESGPGELPDRCPKCKYSAREEANGEE